jgi:hypothetical protein
MPINYANYHPKWTLIRRLILKRAGNCCEKCGVGNHAIGYRDITGCFHPVEPNYAGVAMSVNSNGKLQYWKIIHIVLTIAHLDQDRNNNRFSNLKAYCQRCHFGHDFAANLGARKYGKDWNRIQLKLDL